MSTDRDVTRIVRSWLEEGVTALPDRVLDGVLDQLPATPQRRAWWPAWRLREMNTPIRIAVAVAAVAVVAVIGINILPRNGGVGGPGATASPSPSPSPSPIPSIALLGGSGTNQPLVAGTYRVQDPFPVPFTITFPTVWRPTSLVQGDVSFVKSAPADGTAWVVLDLVDSVFADPCHTDGGPISPPVPSTVDGLVGALTHMVGFKAGPVSDVVVGGFAGKTFELTNAINTETAGCTGGAMLPLWTFRGGPSSGAATNGGATEQIWVIDVGGSAVVIDGETFPTTSAADRLEIGTIVESIKFGP